MTITRTANATPTLSCGWPSDHDEDAHALELDK